jgi:hypothetical protein
MGTYSYKRAYKTSCAKAGVDCRLYDARHTFVTRLAENPAVSEETIRQLAGHVSLRMLARYAHILAQARRDAIATLERPQVLTKPDFEGESPQKSPQSADSGSPVLNAIDFTGQFDWSGRPDLNRRPHAPQACALPGCATPRPGIR